MESRIKRVFLGTLLSSIYLFSPLSFAQEDDSSQKDNEELDKIITPDIERRRIKEDDLDSEDFEVGIYTGTMSVEDFGTNTVAGITVAYHISEDFFAELDYGLTKTEETSYELLSGGVELLTDDQRDLSYYNLSLGINLLPGQIYLWDKWAFNTNFYLIGGAGNTSFAEKQYFTYSYGGGMRFYMTDWLSIDFSLRDHSFEHELFGTPKRIHNLEGRFGMALFF
jgi:outer membrane beta-barrel protein